jgi:hypothetical protein
VVQPLLQLQPLLQRIGSAPLATLVCLVATIQANAEKALVAVLVIPMLQLPRLPLPPPRQPLRQPQLRQLRQLQLQQQPLLLIVCVAWVFRYKKPVVSEGLLNFVMALAIMAHVELVAAVALVVAVHVLGVAVRHLLNGVLGQ